MLRIPNVRARSHLRASTLLMVLGALSSVKFALQVRAKYVYMHACMHACEYLYMYECVCLSVCVCVCILELGGVQLTHCQHFSAGAHAICMHAYMHVCMHTCIHAACIHVCMLVCMHLDMYTHSHTQTHTHNYGADCSCALQAVCCCVLSTVIVISAANIQG